MSDVTRTIFLDSGEQKLQLQRYQLSVQNGTDVDQVTHWEKRKITLGSSPDNDVVLDDPSVSRFHAVIEVDGQGYLLRDNDSKNGTFVDPLQVKEVYLADKTVFRLGQTKIQFAMTNKSAEVHLSGRKQFGDMLGQSVAMREIFSLLERISPTDATVLVEGESGTGKELVADAIHRNSPRKDGPFIVLDCSAIPRDLIESELFGHVKGAFTGATGARKGAFEAAKGGTIFLDELGELALDLQPKLLRALEKREIKPLGSNQTIPIDVRIIAATNRNLLHEVAEGNFREDLYYRFAVIKIQLPPLRDRTDDIPVLVDNFLKKSRQMIGRDDIDISYKTMAKLQRHKWPGNVRELKNFIERAVLLAQGDAIETKFLNVNTPSAQTPPATESAANSLVLTALDEGLPFKDAKNRLVEQFEMEYWTNLLERTDGNISKAARIAGVHRKSVEYILKKLDLTRTSIVNS